MPEISVEDCPSQNFLQDGSLRSSISPAINKIRGLSIAGSKIIRRKTEGYFSFNKKSRDYPVREQGLLGNTRVVSVHLDEPSYTEKPEHNVQEAPSPIYKIALSISATKEERRAFVDYRNTVKRSGWSVISVPVSTLEESAFVVVQNNEDGKVRAANYLAETMLDKALGGALREWK